MVGVSAVAAVAQVIRRKKGLTAVGNAQIDTAQSKFGGSSALFDGTGDYIAVEPASDFAFGTNDFTVEMWVRFNSLPSAGNYVVFYDHRPTSTSGAYISLTLKGSTIVYYSDADRITSSTISTGTWYHLALSRSGTSTKMFIDGTQAGSTYTDSTSYLSTKLFVGGDSLSNTSLYNGWIDEIRVSNSARYTTTFTPSTTPFVNDDNTVLLMHCDGTDASTYFEDDNGVRARRDFYRSGNTVISTTQSKFSGSSIYFDGTDDWLETTYGLVIAGDFTIEAWVYLPNVSGIKSLITIGTENSGRADFMVVNAALRYDIYAAGSADSTGSISTNTWTHIAYVRSGSTITFYIDGVNRGTSTNSSSIGRTDQIRIGQHTASNEDFSGYIDELRVSDTARYSSGFTPSTTPFVNDANTLLLMHGDGTNSSTVFRDDNGATPPVTVAYNTDSYASSLKLAVPFASTSDDVAFSISGTGLSAAATKTQGTSSTISGGGAFGEYSNSLLNAQTGQALTYALPTSITSSASGTFVIEGWFAATDATTNNNWCISSADSGGRFLFGFNTGSTFSFGSENNIGIGTGWHHIAIVCDAGTKRFYYDGIYKGAWVSSNTGFSTLHIGQFNAGDSADFRGRIQDLRVYVGTTKGYSGTSTTAANFALPSPIINIRKSKGMQANGNAAISTTQSKFGGASAVFDATGDYVVLPASQLTFGTGNWTIEGWYRSSTTSGDQYMINFKVPTSQISGIADIDSGNGHWGINIYQSTWRAGAFNNKLVGGVGSGVNTGIDTTTWHHFALVRDSSTTLKYYIDGTQIGSTVTLVATDNFTPTIAYLGSFYYSTSNTSWNGYLDEIRISNTARYTANFTAPTAPFQNDNNTLLLLHADGTNASTVFIDDNGKRPT